MAQCLNAPKFLVAESILKETPHIFIPKCWNRFFEIYVVRLALYMCLKNICDGVGRQNGSNGTSLNPPFFWLDNVFKAFFSTIGRLCGTFIRIHEYRRQNTALCKFTDFYTKSYVLIFLVKPYDVQ